ncbi:MULTISPECIES: LytTR family DNA-binding domain-containing protein [unclassified Fusibacter]|uniref:LytR/AlgR family response regulator transcription factor n=1 Tax=unclassified Fusibacter TaxID=2624464 RepID=UPI00101339B6|nr:MULTISPECIES: LytTR family transcriptional regulator DNA-binding domain-containing protein [unclassified Fusibacter]MCK8058097.1 LytTR family transcriptional regulator DNA-binding domain-containing protein [Fusibacter sp. A2]NPE20679.1 hypothetical protein [Fusibacter sp. A1]RXV62885.1 hypothetical protein DWB64_02510 [Fusibacter sp. A1]
MNCHVMYVGSQDYIIETLKRDIIPESCSGYSFERSQWEGLLESLKTKDIDMIIAETGTKEQLQQLITIRKQWPAVHLVLIALQHFELNDIFSTHPFDMWRIPLQREHMLKTFKEVSELRNILSKTEPIYELSTKQGRVSLPLHHILYFEKQQRKIKVITRDGNYDFYGTIKALKDEKKIASNFVQTHQGFLVNRTHIKCIGHDDVTLFQNNEGIPLSRRFRQSLMHD